MTHNLYHVVCLYISDEQDGVYPINRFIVAETPEAAIPLWRESIRAYRLAEQGGDEEEYDPEMHNDPELPDYIEVIREDVEGPSRDADNEFTIVWRRP